MASSIRISLDISLELNGRLEALAVELGGSKSEVLRRAIPLMELAIKARKEGKVLGIAGAKDRLETEVIGI